MPTTETTVTLSATTHEWLRRVAAQRGMKPDTYADELLAVSLAALMNADKEKILHPFMNSYEGGPMARAELNSMRNEEEDKGIDILEFLARLPQSPTPRAFATWDEYEAFLSEEKNAWDR